MIIISQAPAAASVTAATGGIFQASAGGNLVLNAPGSSRLEGRPFLIRTSGYATLAAGTYTSAVSAILYGGKTLATPGSANALFTATSNVVQSATAATSVPWMVEVILEGDSTSGALQGRGTGIVNNVNQAAAVIAQAPTTVVYSAEPPLVFAAGLTVASNASAAVINSFVLES